MVSRRSYDVFLSYSQIDAGLAEVVSRELSDRGFSVFRVGDLPANQEFPNSVLNALVESRALVVLSTNASANSANVGIDIGAAMGWDKPIFLLHDRDSEFHSLPRLRAAQSFRFDELDKLRRALHQLSPPLDPAGIERLKRIYRKMEIPTDMLLTDTESLDSLSREFNRRSPKKVPAEILAQELLRLRKTGELSADVAAI